MEMYYEVPIYACLKNSQKHCFLREITVLPCLATISEGHSNQYKIDGVIVKSEFAKPVMGKASALGRTVHCLAFSLSGNKGLKYMRMEGGIMPCTDLKYGG